MKRILLIATLLLLSLEIVASAVTVDEMRGVWQSATLTKEENDSTGLSMALLFIVPVEDDTIDVGYVTMKLYCLFKGRAGAYINVVAPAGYDVAGDSVVMTPLDPFEIEVPEETMQFADTLGADERARYVYYFNRVGAMMRDELNAEDKLPFIIRINESHLPDSFTGVLVNRLGEAPTPWYRLL